MYASTVAAAAAALIVPALAAVAPTTGDSYLNGNPFSAPDEKNEPTIGAAFDVKWEATPKTAHGDCSKVKLEVLFGANAATLQPIATIADGIANVGAFSWTPATSLTAAEAQYGLKLTCVVSGDYQYTRLFGIKKAENQASTTSSTSTGPPSYGSTTTAHATTTSSASSSTTADAVSHNSTTAQSTIWTTAVVSHLTTFCPEATTLTFNQATYTVNASAWVTVTDCPCTVSYTTTAAEHSETTAHAVTHVPYPIPHNNATVVLPTGSGSPGVIITATNAVTTAVNVPTAGGATPSLPAGSEGAASSLKATALGAFVAIAVAVLAL